MALPKPLARILSANDAEVRRFLKAAAKEAAERAAALEVAEGIGSMVQRSQLQSVHAVIDDLFLSVGKATFDSTAAAAQVAAELADGPLPALLAEASMSEAEIAAYLRGSVVSAVTNVESAIARLNGLRMPLSERVWRTNALTKGWLDNTINKGLAQGKSARELATDVRRFVSPDTPGGAKYAANRLARTEINNAFHATSVEKYSKAPWITGVLWNLSASHTRVDECNEYAEGEHTPGAGAGVFAPSQVPVKPHPNCWCFITAVQVSDEEFLNSLVAGQYDTYLDDVMRQSGYAPSTTSALAQTAAQTTSTLTSEEAAAQRWSSAAQGEDGYQSLYAKERAQFEALSPAEQDAARLTMKEWQHGDWETIQAGLYGDTVSAEAYYSPRYLSGGVDDFVAKADQLFARSSVPTDVVTKRYTSTGLYDNLDDMLKGDVGDTFTSAGYTATSVAERVKAVTIDGDVLMEIMVPKGSNGLLVDAFTGRSHFAEKELLLNRNSKFTLAQKPWQDGDGTWHVKLVLN